MDRSSPIKNPYFQDLTTRSMSNHLFPPHLFMLYTTMNDVSIVYLWSTYTILTATSSSLSTSSSFFTEFWCLWIIFPTQFQVENASIHIYQLLFPFIPDACHRLSIVGPISQISEQFQEVLLFIPTSTTVFEWDIRRNALLKWILNHSNYYILKLIWFSTFQVLYSWCSEQNF